MIGEVQSQFIYIFLKANAVEMNKKNFCFVIERLKNWGV